MTAPSHNAAALPPADEKWNFAALVGDVSFFFIGVSFLDSSTALPALVEKLGGNATLVGLLLAARQGGYFLPQLFVAHKLHGRTRFKPFLLKVTLLGRLGFWFAALAILVWGHTRPALALALLGFAYVFSWLCDGAGGVPWTALVGRAVSERRRGKLFATTQVFSGISRLFVGVLVAALLSGRIAPFPQSGAWLVLGCAFFVAVSWGFLAVLREPAADAKTDVLPDAPPLGEYIRALPARLRERPDFARLALVQILATASSANAPFITLFALERAMLPAHVPKALAGLLAVLQTGGLPGLFLIFQTLGLLFFAPVWGSLTDRRGPRRSLLWLMGVAVLSPLAALIGGTTGGTGSLFWFLLAFVCFGAVMDGWVTITNYLLEAVPPSEQPTYIGLMNAVSAPALVLPFVCGLLFHALRPQAAFVFAGVLLLGGWLAARSLSDTRKKT